MTTEAERLADALPPPPVMPWIGHDPERGDLFGFTFAELKSYALQALRTQAAALAEREGWVLVPKEPTEAMHQAAVRTIVRCTGNDDFPPRVWRAMLAAAPSTNKPEPIRCPEKLKPGGCQLHNLHCGWPACNKEK